VQALYSVFKAKPLKATGLKNHVIWCKTNAVSRVVEKGKSNLTQIISAT